MAVDVTADLAGALAARLGMQISLSAVPAVEEWMDAALDRWLDQVPFPGELPGGARSRLVVALASDLSRLTWGAAGPAEAFVPRLAEYLAACGASFADVDRLNAVGVELAPDMVGSWIRVEDGRVDTGWELCDPRPASTAAALLGDGAGATEVRDWIGVHGIQSCRRIAGTIGVQDLELELPVEAADLEGAIGVAAAAFRDLARRELPAACKRLLLEAAVADVALAARIADGEIVKLSMIAANPAAATAPPSRDENSAERSRAAAQAPSRSEPEQQPAQEPAQGIDLLRSMCAAAAAPYAQGVRRVAAALACRRAQAVELTAVAAAGERWLVDARFAPHAQPPRAGATGSALN